jgi:hypothetical protein
MDKYNHQKKNRSEKEPTKRPEKLKRKKTWTGTRD